MTEYREYHDPQFARDEAGNQVVTRYPYAGEYVVTDRTGHWEQQIADKSGLRLVRLNADGRVVEPLNDYLNSDDSLMAESWRTIAATIRNEFHPAPVERSKPSTNAGASPKAEADPTTGTARLHKGIAPHIVTETDADGAKVTSLVRQAPRVEEAPQNYQRRTFNPDGLHMDDYMAMRRQGLVPKVEVVGASRKTNTESFDLPAWLAWRSETTVKSEMEEFLEARSKGQVPAQKLREE